MKGISEAKVKCLNRLLERVLQFKHHKYYITFNFNCYVKGVWLSINEISDHDGVAIFNIYYTLSCKNLEKVVDKIINTLNELEKVKNIEDIPTKLPFRHNQFVDMDKIGGR